MKLRNIHENEYAGLEDADEFGGGCEICGLQEDPMRTSVELIHCGSCNNAICYDCAGDNSGWQHNRRYEPPIFHSDDFCRECLAQSQILPESITENEYAGLEDADEFSNNEYVTISGRILGNTKSHRGPIVAPLITQKAIEEIENWLTSHTGLQINVIDDCHVKDKHGGYKQWNFSLFTDTPFETATQLRKMLKKIGYMIKIPTGNFHVDLVDGI